MSNRSAARDERLRPPWRASSVGTDNAQVNASPGQKWLIAAALTVSATLAVYPASQPGAAGSWWVINMFLLVLATRGHRWASLLLAYTTSVGAVILLAAGSGQLTTDPNYFVQGLALATAALLLIRARRYPRMG
jgi:hypothetical protein